MVLFEKYDDLGEYLANETEKVFGGFWSSSVWDWEDDINNAIANSYYDENIGFNVCHIRETKGNKKLDIEFYFKDVEIEDGVFGLDFYRQ